MSPAVQKTSTDRPTGTIPKTGTTPGAAPTAATSTADPSPMSLVREWQRQHQQQPPSRDDASSAPQSAHESPSRSAAAVAVAAANRRRQFLDSMPSQQILMDNIAHLQERLSNGRLLDGGSSRKSHDSDGYDDEDDDIALNGGHQNGNADVDGVKSPAADSLLSDRQQDMEVALIELEARKRKMDRMMRDFARAQNGIAAQMMNSGSPATAAAAVASSSALTASPLRRDRSSEMGSLKRRLVELQAMVEAYDRTSTPRNGRLVAAMGATADTGSTISDISFPDPRRGKAADNLLAEMSAQLQLQKELHLRRKDLEELMRKDILENQGEADDEAELEMRRNLSSSDVRSDASMQHGGRHAQHHHNQRRRRKQQQQQQQQSQSAAEQKAHSIANENVAAGGGAATGLGLGFAGWMNGNHLAPPANHHHSRRSRQASVSSGAHSATTAAVANSARQLHLLQRQVDNLQMEIGILNETAALRQINSTITNGNGSVVGTTLADFLESASTMGTSTTAAAAAAAARRNQILMEDEEARMQLQQQQIQQLTLSLSQCFQTIMAIQHDVGVLQCNVEKLLQQQQQQQRLQQQQQQSHAVSNSSSAIGIVQQAAPSVVNGSGGGAPIAVPAASAPAVTTPPSASLPPTAPTVWPSAPQPPQSDFAPIMPAPPPAVTAASIQPPSGTNGDISAPRNMTSVVPAFGSNNVHGLESQGQQQWVPDDMAAGLWSYPQSDQQQQLQNHWAGDPRPPALPSGQAQQPNNALNNQVAPPMRANNYWDNFRSFSRQNRLSNGGNGGVGVPLHPAAVAPLQVLQQEVQQQQQQQANAVASMMPAATTSSSVVGPVVVTAGTSVPVTAGPVVAQVTPRQVRSGGATTASPSSCSSATAAAAAATAFVEPSFGTGVGLPSGGGATGTSSSSPPRPRRKQKINREQNREGGDSTGAPVAAAAARIESSTSTGGVEATSRNVGGARQRSSDSTSSATSAMVFPMPQQHQSSDRNLNTAAGVTVSPNPMVNSLTRSIYNQVTQLISQHEQRPDQLARIFEDLQSFSARNNATSDSAVLFPDGAATPPVPLQQPDQQQQRPEQAMDSPKLLASKRFFSFGNNGGGTNSRFIPDPTDASGAAAHLPTEAPVNTRYSSFSSPPAPGIPALQPVHSALTEMSALLETTANNNNNSAAPSAATVPTANSSVAVPKNVQRNQISRERDLRKANSNGCSAMGNSSRKNKARNAIPTVVAAAIAPPINANEAPLTATPPSEEGTASSNRNNADAASPGFVTVPVQFHQRVRAEGAAAAAPAAVAAIAAVEDEESEMAEADQDRSVTSPAADCAAGSSFRSLELLPQAEGACSLNGDFHTPEAAEPVEVEEELGAVGSDAGAAALALVGDHDGGLDRVPTRLSASEIERQRLAEEAENDLIGEIVREPPAPSAGEDGDADAAAGGGGGVGVAPRVLEPSEEERDCNGL